jgi:hypothetical protein
VPLSWAQLTMGHNPVADHDRGPCQEVPHGVKQGGELQPPSTRRCSTGALPTPVATTPWLKDIADIAAAQQAESSLWCQDEASVLSPWDISSNQLTHIPNSIFF